MKKVEMTEFMESVQEAVKIMKGELPPSRIFIYDPVDVKRIRKEYKLSQHSFAALFGISINTLRNWEQGRREPHGPAQILLRVAAKHPEAVWDVVHGAAKKKK